MKKNTMDFQHGTVAVIPEKAFEEKLKSNKKLTVKLGMDPTAPDLHLGHAVVLRKMKQFQDAGHKVIFLIGDFTARIGDPSGKSKTRPPLSKEAIERNMQTYFKQVGRVLDINKVEIRYNSEWLDQLSPQDMLNLCGKVTVARIIEREDFANRLKNNQSIGFHELFYPVMQGYDSVALEADIELGGTDQTFNLLMGRFLQEQFGQQSQVVITTPLLEGLDGVQKMSKSLNNYIGLAEPADQAFGKLMSISDKLMWRYAEILLMWSPAKIEEYKAAVVSGSKHPMDLKKQIAHQITADFWTEKEATAAQKKFEDLFQKKDLSKGQAVTLPPGAKNPLWIVELLKTIGALKTSSEAKRLIETGSVLVDEQKITDFKAEISWKTGMTLKVGKHRIYTLQ
jgi:tyrosyl-tRNA synthetase